MPANGRYIAQMTDPRSVLHDTASAIHLLRAPGETCPQRAYAQPQENRCEKSVAPSSHQRQKESAAIGSAEELIWPRVRFS
jgi:hypothetical protein